MSATIATISGDKRIQLANSQLIRRPIILNNWTTIRIGLRLCFPSAASILGTPNLSVGIGSGLTNGIGDTTTTNWLGFVALATTWTITAGPPAYGAQNNGRLRKKVATTVTTNGVTFMNGFFSLDQATLSMLIVEITKGSPNYSAVCVYPGNAASVQTAATQAQLIQIMEAAAGAAASTATSLIPGYTSNSDTMAFSEVAGNVDAIQIYWDRTSVNCEISDVFYRKVA
jgi:hypothetical protein